jgi:hypothetical protein
MPELVLGPVHRFAGETDATMWVELDKTVRGDRIRGSSASAGGGRPDECAS